MSARRIANMVRVDTALTALVAVLFSYFTWSSSRWVSALEERTGAIEAQQQIGSVERGQMKTELALNYREVMRRLDEISRDVKDIKRENGSRGQN